jgi:hypothetical protein
VFATVDGVDFSLLDDSATLDSQVLDQFLALKSIWLTGEQVNDEILAQCARMPQLQTLNLSGESGTATPAGIARLEAASNLDLLGLNGKWVKDETLAGATDLRQLKSLQLYEPNTSSRIFASISELPNLESLVIIRAPGIQDEGTAELARLRKLRTLWLMGTSIGDSSLKSISRLEELDSLELSATNISDAGVPHLNKLTKLRSLSMAHTQVGDRGIQALADLKRLTFLTLIKTQITDECLPTIAGMTELQSLYLEFRAAPHPERLLQLCALKQLRHLNITGPGIAPETVDALRKGLPKCQVSVFNQTGLGVRP